MKTLVTGGAGFIGSNLARALVHRGYEVRVLDNFSTGHRANLVDLDIEFVEGDLRSYERVAAATRNVDLVFHQGALPSVPRLRHSYLGAAHVRNCGVGRCLTDMRILMLSPHPGVRGPLPKLTPVLVKALVSLGCEVVTEPWGRHDDHESLPQKVMARSLDIPRIRRRLVTEPFDVMVVQTSHEGRSLLANVPLLAATRRLVSKIVVQFHGGRSDLLVGPGQRAFKSASAALFALSDGVLVLSTEEARESRSFWPRGHFRVVANPLVQSREMGVVGSRTDHRRDGTLSLLFVGRLIEEKGIFETLSAFAMLTQHRAARLVIAGDGPSAAEVARRVEHLGIQEKVTLTGFLSGKSLQDAYRAADVFVFPSYREGFPTAITEALAAGLPVVTTRTRGMADHLVEGKNALFVSPRDSSGLAAALERIIGDGELRMQMSVANTAKVADFAADRVAERYLEILTELVDREPVRSGHPGQRK
jgi:glycosyltransferase involved in cell wall biosynthesis